MERRSHSETKVAQPADAELLMLDFPESAPNYGEQGFRGVDITGAAIGALGHVGTGDKDKVVRER